MALWHLARKIKEIWHMGRRVKEIWFMGRLIWSAFKPRTFTVTMNPGGFFSSPSWNTGSVTGDSTLVQSISGGGLYLAANATYTRTDGKTTGLRTSGGRAFSAGEPLPAGVQLVGDAGTYTITEAQNKPVEVMPPTPNTYDAQNWLRNTVAKYGMGYTTVTELPFDIDSRNATVVQAMFAGCSSLTSVPQMDTSNVTNIGNIFSGCSSLTTVPQMDTRNATSMKFMFADCSSLTSVPQMDTRNVTTMRYMFQNCRSLTDGNAALTVKRRGADTTGMIDGSGLTREPFLTIE